MSSIFLDSILHIWNSTAEHEKQMVMNQLAEKYGIHYSREQFFKYLEQIYRPRFSLFVLPPLPERRAISYQS